MSINIKAYLKEPNNCPFCYSADTAALDTDFEDITAWRNVVCESCHKKWTEEFILTGITEQGVE